MKNVLMILVAGFVICLCGTINASAADLRLANDGQSAYVIRLCAHSSEADKYAADELQKFLMEISGVKLPIQDAGSMPKYAILVGKDAQSERLVPHVNSSKLGDEGFIVATAGPRLVLAGNKPRGTLYAVYSFLDQELGCRWVAPDASRIPRRRHLTIRSINRTFVPQLEYREICSWDAQADRGWAARNFLNANCATYPSPKNDTLRGGTVMYAGKQFVHTLYCLLPPEKYFAKHPEWYSEKDSKRTYEGGQLCLTNPEVVKAMTEEVRKALRANPSAKIISVSQNDVDASSFCQCAKCRAVYKEEGAYSGAVIRFVNQVADAIQPEFPDVAIDTLAYWFTREAPKNVRPRPNVIVRLCTTECCYSHPYATCPQSESFVRDMESWAKICKRLYIWDYAGNLLNYLVPYPDLNVLEPNIKFFAAHNVTGIFSEGMYASPGAELAELRDYIIARLLWNPSYGAVRARDEFLDIYYGPAASPVREYLNLMDKAAHEQNSHFTWNVKPDASWISPELMSRAWVLFDKAERLAAGKPEILKRVRIARLPIRYVTLVEGPGWDARGWTRKTTAGSVNWSSKESIDQFLAVASEANLTHVAENVPYGPFRENLLSRPEMNRVKLPPPPGTENIPASSIVDLPNSFFKYWHPGVLSGRIDDKTACYGKCVWLKGSTPEWNVQCDIPFPLLTGSRYRVYTIVRVEKANDNGDAFGCGIYDASASKDLVKRVVTAKEATTTWKTCEIGEVDAKSQLFAWFSGIKDSTSVSRIFIDRIYLVKER